MRLFLDSALVEDVEQAASWGYVDGVTTNPSLLKKANTPLHQTIRRICEIIDGPVSAEVVHTEAVAMLQQAHELAAIHPNVVVKLPLTVAGLQCTKQLSQAGIATNVTLCFSLSQGLLAAKAGATFVSPFVGRLDDLDIAGMQLVEQLVSVYRHYGFSTQVLAASIRSDKHIMAAARAGAHALTAPLGLLKKMVHHRLTDEGLAIFLKDAGMA